MDNIIIKRVAYKYLRILIKKFMAKKISVLTYIKTITGNNLYKIFYGFTYKNGKEKLSIKDYEIIYPIRTGEKIVKARRIIFITLTLKLHSINLYLKVIQKYLKE